MTIRLQRVGAAWALALTSCASPSPASTIPAGSCNQVADPTNSVPMNTIVGARPSAAGGTLVDGEYETVERTYYVEKMTGESFAPVSDRYRIKGRTIEIAARIPGSDDVDRRTFTLSTSGTSLAYAASCPADGSAIDFGYTATATEVRFFKPPTGASGFVTVLRRIGP